MPGIRSQSQGSALTHGHFDHILAVKDICRAFPCKVYAGREEDRLLQDAFLNLSGTMGTEQTVIEADELVKDGTCFRLPAFLESIRDAGAYGRIRVLLCRVRGCGVQRRHSVCRFPGKDGSAHRRCKSHCPFYQGKAFHLTGRYHGISGTWGGHCHWP